MPLNLSKLQELRTKQSKDKPKEPTPLPEAVPAPAVEPELVDIPLMEDPIMEALSEQEVTIPEPAPAPKPRTRKPKPAPAPAFTPQPVTPTQPIFTVPEPNPQVTAPFPSGNKNVFFKNLATVMKNVKDNEQDLEDGSYTGIITDANFRESKAGNKMIIVNIDITTKRGLPAKGEATKFFMLEHTNQKTVDIALRQIRNMLLTVGIVVDYETDLELVFNNLGDYWKNKAVTFEVKGGFVNIKEFHGQRA